MIERLDAHTPPTPAAQKREPRATVTSQRFQTAEPTPASKVASGRVRGAMVFAFKLDRGAFNKRGQFFAGDIGINPIPERLFFPIEPGLQIFGLKAGTVAAIVNLQQTPRNAVVDLAPGYRGGGHHATTRSDLRTWTARRFAAHTRAA